MENNNDPKDNEVLAIDGEVAQPGSMALDPPFPERLLRVLELAIDTGGCRYLLRFSPRGDWMLFYVRHAWETAWSPYIRTAGSVFREVMRIPREDVAYELATSTRDPNHILTLFLKLRMDGMLDN